uniref:Methyltransferase type 11 domain-containing protein n=1 Tax=Oryza punctata TaxID=4537 RepID=A0A0E0L4C3_ORYPU
MDRRVQRLVSGLAATAATVSLLCLISHASTSCFAGVTTLSHAPFPRTSCDAASRRVVPPDRRLAKLRSSALWRRRSVALASSSVLASLRGLRLLAGSSRVLCLAAGAGHAVDALRAEGVGDVTGIDLVDFPPLVRRADPHNLPFADAAFELIFSDDPAGFSGALFPSQIAAEAERAVRPGGALALAVDRNLDPSAVAALFKRSRIVDQRDLTMDGSQVRMLIFQSNGTTSNSH